MVTLTHSAGVPASWRYTTENTNVVVRTPDRGVTIAPERWTSLSAADAGPAKAAAETANATTTTAHSRALRVSMR